MSWNGVDPTWSKEFKDYAFYSLRNSPTMAGDASEWLFDLYCSHESIETFDHDPTDAELEVYTKHVSALINQSKELKVIREFFRDMGEAHGHDYMKDFRKDMRKNWGVVIE